MLVRPGLGHAPGAMALFGSSSRGGDGARGAPPSLRSSHKHGATNTGVIQSRCGRLLVAVSVDCRGTLLSLGTEPFRLCGPTISSARGPPPPDLPAGPPPPYPVLTAMAPIDLDAGVRMVCLWAALAQGPLIFPQRGWRRRHCSEVFANPQHLHLPSLPKEGISRVVIALQARPSSDHHGAQRGKGDLVTDSPAPRRPGTGVSPRFCPKRTYEDQRSKSGQSNGALSMVSLYQSSRGQTKYPMACLVSLGRRSLAGQLGTPPRHDQPCAPSHLPVCEPSCQLRMCLNVKFASLRSLDPGQWRGGVGRVAALPCRERAATRWGQAASPAAS